MADKNNLMTQAMAEHDLRMRDHELARAKGNSPDHLEARRRVARLFCDIHLPAQPAPPLLDAIDFSQPLSVTNARGIALDRPKKTGFLRLGPKPAYLLSAAYPPQKADDPIYALEYYPLKP